MLRYAADLPRFVLALSNVDLVEFNQKATGSTLSEAKGFMLCVNSESWLTVPGSAS